MTFKDYIGKEQLTAEEQKLLIDELNKTSVVIPGRNLYHRRSNRISYEN